mmetsp:Transcript_16140/g.48342  ORF Transcript_16140/g.48342 Transcript_16140/m.48342 type:complete len:255 (+) Transcript_16140:372-1136(+)
MSVVFIADLSALPFLTSTTSAGKNFSTTTPCTSAHLRLCPARVLTSTMILLGWAKASRRVASYCRYHAFGHCASKGVVAAGRPVLCGAALLFLLQSRWLKTNTGANNRKLGTLSRPICLASLRGIRQEVCPLAPMLVLNHQRLPCWCWWHFFVHLHCVVHVEEVPGPDSKTNQVFRLREAKSQTQPCGTGDCIVSAAQQQQRQRQAPGNVLDCFQQGPPVATVPLCVSGCEEGYFEVAQTHSYCRRTDRFASCQ